MQIKILGNGVWGNALCSVVRENYPTASILKRGDKITDFDVLILAIPTQSIREALESIPPEKRNKIIINTAKGIEKSTYLLPYQIVQSVLGSGIEYYTLIGPSFAREVVERMPTLVNLGSMKKNANSQKIKELFQTNYFRVRLTKDVEVLELSAAFKNIYAIACGMANGLGYEENTRIKLLILAIEEMNKLYKKLGLKSEPSSTVGTIGDLILTCNSGESRNFAFGELLAAYSVEAALSKINKTIEGLNSLSSIEYFKKKAKTKLPLASLVSNIIQIDNPKKVRALFEKFISSI